MKTQINELRSGTKNQRLNPEIDYTKLPQATSHIGHGGTNHEIVGDIWSKVKKENPEKMKIRLFGQVLELKANWSGSGKSVTYNAILDREFFKENFKSLDLSKKNEPYISIQDGNYIIVHNGKNSYVHVCPSLIKIL